MTTRHAMVRTSAVGLLALALAALMAPVRAQSSPDRLIVITSGGRQTLQTIERRGRDMVALSDLATLLALDVREDRANAFVVTHGTATVILTPDQRSVSVGGRLVSLSAAPSRDDGRLLVPLDFVSRALSPIYESELELRPRSGLLIVGAVRVPRVEVDYRARRDTGRIQVEIVPNTPHTVTRDGDRLVIHFNADAIDASRLPRGRGSLVDGFELVPLLPGIAVELGDAFGEFSVSSLPAPGDAAQLVVELTAAGRTTTDAAPAVTPPVGLPMPTAVDPLPDFTSAPTVRTVVIDAGHGGEEDGARGPEGTLEKDITLSVARRLRDAIESRLGLRVILTRNRDETVDLDERAAIANNNKADLFISFHANASTHPGPEGAAVFYLSIDEYGEEARELAGREGQAIPVVGGGTREIDLILWEMAQVRYLEHSAQFAGYLEGELGRRVTMSQGAIQQAPFRVLVGANMPAVLVEMGFISNPRQETEMATARFQQSVVEAVIAGILRYQDYLEQSSRALVGPPGATPGVGASVQGRVP